MSRWLSSQPDSMGLRKAYSNSRRSALQLKKRQDTTESRRILRASLQTHLVLVGLQPEDWTQLAAHAEKSKLAWAGVAKERRAAAPTRASRRCLTKTIFYLASTVLTW